MSVLDTRISWTRLALSLALSLVGNAGMWAIIVILPAVQAEFGVDRATASLPYTLTMVGFALGNWVIGRWVDRYGVGRVLAVAALVMAGSFAGAAAAPNIATLSALQLVVGFATAASFGPLIADVSQWFLRRRGIAVAIIASGNYLSGAIWPLVLADILAGPGWRPAYLVIAASALLIMLPLSYALRKTASPTRAMQASAAAAALRAKTAGIPQNTLLWLLALAGIGCCVRHGHAAGPYRGLLRGPRLRAPPWAPRCSR